MEGAVPQVSGPLHDRQRHLRAEPLGRIRELNPRASTMARATASGPRQGDRLRQRRQGAGRRRALNVHLGSEAAAGN